MGYEPKELATVSRIEAHSGDPYQLYDVQENFGEEDHRALVSEEVRNLERLGRLACRILNCQRRPSSNRRCISTIPWKALQTLISKMESYKKMQTSPLYAKKASEKSDAMAMQEREVSAQNTQADRKASLRSPSSEGSESFGETRCIVFICTGSEKIIRQIEDLFLKVIRITHPQSGKIRRSKNFMSNLSISASVNYKDKWKSKDWHCSPKYSCTKCTRDGEK